MFFVDMFLDERGMLNRSRMLRIARSNIATAWRSGLVGTRGTVVGCAIWHIEHKRR